jgi:hypothetical protein
MRFTVLSLLVLIFCPFAFVADADNQIKPPAEGGTLPQIVLRVPGDSDLQQYLGIAGKETFTIPEINAEVVIIEIFSMY